MVLKATIQKQSSKQSLRKVHSEADIRRCSSTYMFRKNFATGKHLCWSLFLIKLQVYEKEIPTQRTCFPVNIAKFLRTTFFTENPGGCFCQFDKVTVQYWASAKFLFLFKNTTWDGF